MKTFIERDTFIQEIGKALPDITDVGEIGEIEVTSNNRYVSIEVIYKNKKFKLSIEQI